MEEQFLSPLPHVIADWAAIGHPVAFINIIHVMTIILHNEWFYGIPLFVTEVTSCWWILNVCQHVDVSFVPPYCCCQDTPGPHTNVTPFQFHFLGSYILQYALPIWSHSPTSFFFRSSNKSEEEKKLHKQFVTSAIYFPSNLCHCSMCSCHVLCLAFPKYTFMSYM